MANYRRLKYHGGLTDIEYRAALVLEHLDARGGRVLSRKLRTGMHSWEHSEFNAAIDLLVSQGCIRVERVRAPGDRGWKKWVQLLQIPRRYQERTIKNERRKRRNRRPPTTWFMANVLPEVH